MRYQNSVSAVCATKCRIVLPHGGVPRSLLKHRANLAQRRGELVRVVRGWILQLLE